jgi:hypothetical protein
MIMDDHGCTPSGVRASFAPGSLKAMWPSGPIPPRKSSIPPYAWIFSSYLDADAPPATDITSPAERDSRRAGLGLGDGAPLALQLQVFRIAVEDVDVVSLGTGWGTRACDLRWGSQQCSWRQAPRQSQIPLCLQKLADLPPERLSPARARIINTSRCRPLLIHRCPHLHVHVIEQVGVHEAMVALWVPNREAHISAATVVSAPARRDRCRCSVHLAHAAELGVRRVAHSLVHVEGHHMLERERAGGDVPDKRLVGGDLRAILSLPSLTAMAGRPPAGGTPSSHALPRSATSRALLSPPSPSR